MMDLATVKSHGKFVRAPVLYRLKVIDHYNEQNISLRGIRVGFPSSIIDEQALEYIEVQKLNETEHLLDRITTEAST